jgi:hypothetical protein
MKNVKFSVKANILTITVDLTERHGLSSTGKTVSIASTAGNVSLDDPHADVKVGLNVYVKNVAEAKA